MPAILKQTFYLLVALLCIYGALLALSYAFVPAHNELSGLNSASSSGNIFATEPKYVFLNRQAVRPDADRIVFVGASNMSVGFKQQEVQSLLPSAEVDNLSVGGSNMTQISQIVDLIQELQVPAARRRTTFVIGVWFGMLVPDELRWSTPDRHKGDTDIDIERYRYGFYRRTDSGPRQSLPSNDLSFGVMLLHPYLVFDDLSRRISKGVRERLSSKPTRRTDVDRDASNVSEEERVKALEYWREQMHSDGPIAEEQIVVLRNLITKILAQGSKVLLIDLPIPRWHAERSPFYAVYLNRKSDLLAGLKGTPGFTYFEMADSNDDFDFSDEVHPKPRVTPIWAARVAALLRGAQT